MSHMLKIAVDVINRTFRTIHSLLVLATSTTSISRAIVIIQHNDNNDISSTHCSIEYQCSSTVSIHERQNVLPIQSRKEKGD